MNNKDFMKRAKEISFSRGISLSDAEFELKEELKEYNYKMLHIIVSTYQQIHELKVLIHSLFQQDNEKFQLYIYGDGDDFDYIYWMVENEFNYVRKPVIEYRKSVKRYNDFGHSLRAIGLQELQAKENDYILFTNGDNYYVPIFVEEMMKATEEDNVGVVFCDMIHSHDRKDSSSGGTYGYFNTEFLPCKCDIGAFIVRYDIAKKVGFNHRHNEADSEFIREILQYQKENNFKIKKVNKVLFVHN